MTDLYTGLVLGSKWVIEIEFQGLGHYLIFDI